MVKWVAPLVGAWIEIIMELNVLLRRLVAPLVGAWIEILIPQINMPQLHVAPLVGAWIEIEFLGVMTRTEMRRSSRGSVD